MEYPDKNEHLNDDQIDNASKKNEEPTGQANTGESENIGAASAPDEEAAAPIEEIEKEAPAATGINPEREASDSENGVTDESVDDKKTIESTPAEGNQETDNNPSVEKVSKQHFKQEKAKREIEAEKVNYELLSKPDLVKILDDIIRQNDFDQIRSVFDDIHAIYTVKHEEEIAAKRESFISEGGLEQDFKPIEDPVDKRMHELLEKYKTLKADYNKQIEDEKEANLALKLEILEEFRLLMEKQEGFENTFRKFKQLQKRWFDIGIVPKQNVRDLWNSYNFFVDKFNDYVNISQELRTLDLKKNLDQKAVICEKAEELLKDENIVNAFKTLQTLHSQWREIGPVPREDKDMIWQRFKKATSEINRAHQHYQSELRGSLIENLQLKTALCEKVESISQLQLEQHKDWVEKTDEILKIQRDWKNIGFAPKKENNKIYARFRKACDQFFEKKAVFYADSLEHQKESMQQKKDIIAAAEELKDSTDWKNTTEKFIELQKKWKEIGPVPRKESDKLWRKFRSICDYFFEKKSEFFSGKDDSYIENLRAKEALIKEVRECSPPTQLKQLKQLLEEFQHRYDEIGFVPVEDKDRIRDEFRDAVNDLVNRLDIDEKEKLLIQFRLKVSSIMQGPRGENKLMFEREKLMTKLQQLKNDMGVWENNIGFFKQTSSAEGTISEFTEKIEDAQFRIDLMEKKIRIIDEFEDN
jgi:hypothetical protein